ncbi:MAG: hypothetical protein GYB68_17865, partial [Chloroflexi bacterium]|nr:hypothetical protein [Chloroflexota bacterium]
MQLSWHFEQHEIETVQRLVAERLASGRSLLPYRLRHNVEGTPPVIDDDTLWLTIMMCLLTTPQRSGPNSPVYQLLERSPFPLSLAACHSFDSVQEAALQLLTEADGIRRVNKIAAAISANLVLLEQGEWDHLRAWRDRLLAQRAVRPDLALRDLEEQAAEYMDRFQQFGPKQSRNF